ncbi:MAG: hypothetical protein B7Z66_14785 [Chromatiales bacterium 21-64-14]|nr:MAG: hypothetical protein B7Z66_14785 [Chromatiales bacterium 21-64-14]HQU17298.1 hypothetical protein [Gammaproteobacteria bacterium]
MRFNRKLLCTSALLLAFSTGAVHADGRYGHGGHSGVRFGLLLGAPLFWSSFYGPRYYANPYPPVVVYSEPPVYVDPTPQQGASDYYWYYCTSPPGYYPYVRECPPGWMKVVPAAPPR